MTRSGSDLVFLLTEKESPLAIEWPTDEEGRYVVGAWNFLGRPWDSITAVVSVRILP